MTPDQYLAALEPERRAALSAIRNLIRERLPAGFEEGVLFGMIAYYVPLSRYPKTYNGQPLLFAALASQKAHMALYLTCPYADPVERARFEAAWKKTGRKLDMGKSCVRFKKLEDVALETVGDSIARVPLDAFVAQYERIRAGTKAGQKEVASKKAAVGREKSAASGAKKGAAKKTAARR